MCCDVHELRFIALIIQVYGSEVYTSGRCLGRCLLSMHLHARACRAREEATKAANNQCVHGMSCAKNASNSQRMHQTVKETNDERTNQLVLLDVLTMKECNMLHHDFINSLHQFFARATAKCHRAPDLDLSASLCTATYKCQFLSFSCSSVVFSIYV